MSLSLLFLLPKLTMSWLWLNQSHLSPVTVCQFRTLKTRMCLFLTPTILTKSLSTASLVASSPSQLDTVQRTTAFLKVRHSTCSRPGTLVSLLYLFFQRRVEHWHCQLKLSTPLLHMSPPAYIGSYKFVLVVRVAVSRFDFTLCFQQQSLFNSLDIFFVIL